MVVPPLALALLDALEEPALIVAGERTVAANPPARRALGPDLVGQDIRFAIRQPQALDAILAGRIGRFEVTGIGGIGRSWTVTVRRLDPTLLLVRLRDRSAARGVERAQVDFVANASHELRTPLATVIGYAETLAEDGPLPEALRRRFGGQIHSEASRMLQIVRDLMGLSRIEADRFVEPRERVALKPLIEEAVVAAGAMAAREGCVIDCRLESGLGPIRGDPAQLRQLLDNLLTNAVRYGCRQEGGRITVTLEARGGQQRLGVADTGEGIAPEHLPRLTERFYRIDPARSRDRGGTGLGLAIVKQIVERHRGSLEIQSTPGRGTAVSVALPAG